MPSRFTLPDLPATAMVCDVLDTALIKAGITMDVTPSFDGASVSFRMPLGSRELSAYGRFFEPDGFINFQLELPPNSAEAAITAPQTPIAEIRVGQASASELVVRGTHFGGDALADYASAMRLIFELANTLDVAYASAAAIAD